MFLWIGVSVLLILLGVCLGRWEEKRDRQKRLDTLRRRVRGSRRY